MARRERTWIAKSAPLLAAAAALVSLVTFASLASGAGRIESRRPAGRIAIAKAWFAPARALAAGDRVQRLLELKTGGRTRVTMNVAARKASALVDPRLGLRIKVERCSKAWRAARAGYSCRGKRTLVTRDGPALGRHPLRKLDRRRSNHLRVTLTLPASAPTALEGQTAQLVYRFG
jgi:hypothetical protein